MGNRKHWNPHEPLSPDLVRKWRTEWGSPDLSTTEKRLQRLYDLRQFAELCGPEIPASWRRFLADELDLGERRQAALVFEEGVAPDSEPESTTVEAEVVMVGQYEATDEDIPF